MTNAAVINSYSWEIVDDNCRWLIHKGRFFRAGWCPMIQSQGTWALEEFEGRHPGAKLISIIDRAVPTRSLSDKVIEVIYG